MTAFDPYAYLDAAAAALELPIPAERRDAVAANLARLHALAQEVLAWRAETDLPNAP
jgi:Protein of unknown function (DUF4089)